MITKTQVFAGAFVAYFCYNIYSIYRTIAAPVASEYVKQNLNGLSKQDLKGIPDVIVNAYSSDEQISYDMVLSPYPGLPDLKELSKYAQEYKAQHGQDPKEFVFVGNTEFYNYDFKDDENLEFSSGKKTGNFFNSFIRKITRSLSSWRDYMDLSGSYTATFTATIPEHFRKDEPLYLHVYATKKESNTVLFKEVRPITVSMVPESHRVIKRYLLQDISGQKLAKKLKGLAVPGPPSQCIPEHVLVGPVIEHRPLHLPSFYQKFGVGSTLVNVESKEFRLPIFISPDVSPQDEYRPLAHSPLDDINESDESKKDLVLNILYQPVGFAYWFLQLVVANSFALLQQKMHFDNYDLNSLKMTVATAAKKNSFFVLFCIVFFSFFHCLLEILAVKSDLEFWRNQTNPSSLFSLRGLIYELVMELVVALYLHEADSKLPLFFTVLKIILNFWKIRKFLDIRLQRHWKFISVSKKPCMLAGDGDSDKKEATDGNFSVDLLNGADAFESKCTRLLLLVALVPTVVGVTSYQLIYVPQKGWYSWFVTSSALCCYLLGFLAMTPQLFRNYYVKSVEFMPFRVLFYNFINTFIDDVAACVIRMPKMHRVSVFRDDIIFVVYLYQRWIYRKSSKLGNFKEETQKKNQ